MPQQVAVSVENNFTKGLITENTGLNFPENAATDTDNCEYTLIGEVLRRLGVNREVNGTNATLDRTGKAVNTYKWNNAGGDGSTQLLVVAIGGNLSFYGASNATTTAPLSTQLQGTIPILNYYPLGTTMDTTIAVEFTDGNGYLFGFHPSIDPFYAYLTPGLGVTLVPITVQIRDFAGVLEPSTPDNSRPSALTDSHKYNLQNQGWVSQTPWTTTSTTNITSITSGSKAFTVPAGIPGIAVSQYVYIQAASTTGAFIPLWTYGTITSYVGTTLTINVVSWANASGIAAWPGGFAPGYWYIAPVSTGYINTFVGALGVYPSNADQWWRFKTVNNVFDPATVNVNISVGLGAAPKGHYILNAFDQQRDQVSGVLTITDITTTKRPSNGCWFQGRVWYTGVNTSQAPTGTAPFYTWSENIYFSQVVVGTQDFGKCYQVNDPTTQELFDLLPTDGGVITIQGSGPIYKLFSTQNGLLVFAANGIWFITGSQGIGFTANDYTVTKISSVQSISTTSFVDVLGLPYFWNEEGIYKVTATQNGALTVDPITHMTIETFYGDIPLASKKLVRGVYNPIEYVIQWLYRSTNSSSITEAYTSDRVLNYSTANQAFFPYTFSASTAGVACVNYMAGPGGSTTPPPTFKYLTFNGTSATFSDLNDATYVDWAYTGTSVNYISYLVTGYKIRGQAIKRFQPQYVQVYSNINNVDSGYKIQGVWDYSIDRNSNRYSGVQVASFDASTYYSVKYKRHKIRGHGYALQFRILSQDGRPFDLIGWAVIDTVNQGS